MWFRVELKNVGLITLVSSGSTCNVLEDTLKVQAVKISLYCVLLLVCFTFLTAVTHPKLINQTTKYACKPVWNVEFLCTG